jgi:stearoyl-CoA desaturase (Delta-9 desaturase)
MSAAQPVERKPPLIWTNTLMFSLTFLVAVTVVPWYGFQYGYSGAAWVLLFVFLVANGMSITGGYHRLWAHRSYDAHWSLRLFYMVFGSMALQNSALIWCSGHRTHHIHVDDNDRDPYSARRGFWFSHMGWMVRTYPSGLPDLSNVRDLQRDPLLAFQHRFYVPLVLATNFGFPLLAGWLVGDILGTFLLAGVLRLVLSHHFTFFINSLAHIWGSQPYTDQNTARDNGVLAIVTHGEGYHNFHHIFAHDYRNGVRWWQWDPTKWLIASLSWVGITRNLRRVPDFQIQKAAVAMQFKRAQERLSRLAEEGPGTARVNLEALRARLAGEYEHFMAAMTQWTELRDRWYEEKRRSLAETGRALRRQIEDTGAGLQQQIRELERQLKMQRKRLRVLQAQLA